MGEPQDTARKQTAKFSNLLLQSPGCHHSVLKVPSVRGEESRTDLRFWQAQAPRPFAELRKEGALNPSPAPGTTYLIQGNIINLGKEERDCGLCARHDLWQFPRTAQLISQPAAAQKGGKSFILPLPLEPVTGCSTQTPMCQPSSQGKKL